MTDADAPRGTLILLVEDDAPMARLVAEALCEEQGFQVLILPDASFALSLVEAMPADLVLLDLNLPGNRRSATPRPLAPGSRVPAHPHPVRHRESR